MSKSDLLSSTLNWPGKGIYGLKSSVLQTTESDLVKQSIVSNHMASHYRRLNNVRSAVDSKPPKAMILSQKCRDRARKEQAQLGYTQNIIDQFSGQSFRNTARGRSAQSARSQKFIQSQPVTSRARSRSIESARMITRSLTMSGSTQNLRRTESTGAGDMQTKLFEDPAMSRALTAMTALGKLTSSERNKSSADVLDKHPDSFKQPEPNEYKPRLVKRDGNSFLRENTKYYNPPRRTPSRRNSTQKLEETAPDEPPKGKQDEQLTLREQLNRSLEVRDNVEKKIKTAKMKSKAQPEIKKQSDRMLKQFGLSEHEHLQYVRFMKNVTDAIIRNNLTTEDAIERLYEIHIDRHRETLDENRLRSLLEALKEDLGVRTSRKPGDYATVHKATTYDSQPLPPEVSTARTDQSLLSTQRNPPIDERRLSEELKTPFSWQTNDDTDRQDVKSRQKQFNSYNIHPVSTYQVDIKPNTQFQPRIEHEKAEINSSFMNPSHSNGNMRKPMNGMHDSHMMNNSELTELNEPLRPSNEQEEAEFNSILTVAPHLNETSPKTMNNAHDISWLKDSKSAEQIIETPSPMYKGEKEFITNPSQENSLSEEDNQHEDNKYSDDEFDVDNDEDE